MLWYSSYYNLFLIDSMRGALDIMKALEGLSLFRRYVQPVSI